MFAENTRRESKDAKAHFSELFIFWGHIHDNVWQRLPKALEKIGASFTGAIYRPKIYPLSVYS